MFGLERDEAAALLEDLRVRVQARWHAALREAGIASVDIERFANSFAESSKDAWQHTMDQF